MGAFNPSAFNNDAFNTRDDTPPTGGGRRRIGPVRVQAKRIPGTEDEFLVWWLVTFLLAVLP